MTYGKATLSLIISSLRSALITSNLTIIYIDGVYQQLNTQKRLAKVEDMFFVTYQPAYARCLVRGFTCENPLK
jgi:hypothetical protein